jgi:hypothetical protein
MKKYLLLIFTLLSGLGLLALTRQVDAAPPAQVYYYTPTPRPDGRIIYIVKAGDSCIRVALLNNISEQKLRELNGITGSDCPLVEGAELLIGMLREETPTPGPSPTATPLLPTPTEFRGYGIVCVVLFDDLNGNARLDTGELWLPGGAINITDRRGRVNLNGETVANNVDEKPTCFENLEEGDYNVSVAMPGGYNATTSMNTPLKLTAGDTSTLDFGAQVSNQTLPEEAIPAEGARSPLLGIIGGLLVLAGLGIGIYFRFLKK